MSDTVGGDGGVPGLTDEQILSVRTILGFQLRRIVALSREGKPKRVASIANALRPLMRFGLPGEPIDDDMRRPLDDEDARALQDAAFYVAQWSVTMRTRIPGRQCYYDTISAQADDLTRVAGGGPRLDVWLATYATEPPHDPGE